MKEQIEEMRNFMLEKSNSANVEPVFTTNDGKEIVLGKELTKLLNDVLEQAFIPFLAESLYNAGYRKQIEVIDEFVKMLKEEMNNLSRMEYHCDPYFLVSEAFIDKIAEEMKGGAK